MALALGFQRMLVPSGGMLGELIPRATHPDLDPLFSTERTEILHYGFASRLQKVTRVAQSPDALRTVQVCRLNRSAQDTNCGRCEKCIRTMIHLHLLGKLDSVPGLFEEARLDPHVVASMSKEIKHPHQWQDLLIALPDTEDNRELAAAIRLVIARAHLRNAYEHMHEHADDPALATLREDFPDTLKDGYRVVRMLHRGLHPDSPPQGPQRRRALMKAVRWGTRFEDRE
jgi:hypothetical protein